MACSSIRESMSVGQTRVKQLHVEEVRPGDKRGVCVVGVALNGSLFSAVLRRGTR